MAQKTVYLPEIGEVILAKRKGTRQLRLSVRADGRVRVGMPAWVPYQAGINFALSRSDWIKKHIRDSDEITLKPGVRIGKSYRLTFLQNEKYDTIRSRIVDHNVIVRSSLIYSDPAVQKSAIRISERALKRDAEKLLPIRLDELAKKHSFKYKSVRIKRLRSRWGSCSSQKEITLNYYLIQLPWPLIDYVLLHELTHTEHLHHGPAFWLKIESLLPDFKRHRQAIKKYKPILSAIPVA